MHTNARDTTSRAFVVPPRAYAAVPGGQETFTVSLQITDTKMATNP